MDFLFNLEHIGQQMPKFTSIATHLSIPWDEYMGQVESLKEMSVGVLEAGKNRDIRYEEILPLCDVRDLLVDSLRGIDDVIGEAELYKLKPLLMKSVPKFINPRVDRAEWQATPFSKHEFTED